MKSDRDWIHRIIDGDEADAAPAEGSPESRQLQRYEELLGALSQCREAPPEDLVERIQARLGPAPQRGWAARLQNWWPQQGRWAAPALAGAVLALLVAVSLGRLPQTAPAGAGVAVTFELHAPGAHTVELVGTFNDWRPGAATLTGPDATGHWHATLEVPPGRHEYLFLVDGERWVTDPSAVAHRPDGFGRENALIEL